MPPKKKIIAEPVVESNEDEIKPKVTKPRAKKADIPVEKSEPVKKSKKANPPPIDSVPDKPNKVEKKTVKQKKIIEKNITVNEIDDEFSALKLELLNTITEIEQFQRCIEIKQQEQVEIIKKMILLNDKMETPAITETTDKNLESIFNTRNSNDDNVPSKIIISSDSESSNSSSDDSDESVVKNTKTKKLGLFGKKAKSLSSDSDSD